MPKRFEFWFEFASTYSYLSAMRIEALCNAAQVEIAWRPFLLGPIFKAQGWESSPFNLYPAKGAYMWQDMAREAARLGLPFTRPSLFPQNGLHAARIACAAKTAPWLPEFVRAVYTASFAHGRDISAQATLAQILQTLGQDPEALFAQAQSQEVKAQLRANTEAAQSKGLFGAPSFIVGETLFWGNDRLEAAIEHAIST